MARNHGHRLPEPIGKETHFTWGPVRKIHKIEALEITIVEYDDGDNNIMFSIYLNNEAVGMSCASLETAIIYAIACRKLGQCKVFNGNYAFFACKILDLN